MKKTYINPKMRVVNITETDAVLLAQSPNTPADPNQPIGSRRSRLIDDWDEEDW